ncbi:MAG: pyruvate formate lyase family protein, partial [Clostridia bacterium]|nr:pyruvate formate lyase family protein [Clostridia bacterium]
QKKYNITTGIDADAHFACDYRIGLSLGFGGLLEKIRRYRTVNPDKKAFYDAEERCVLAIIDFVDRHIAKIGEMIPDETRPEIKESLVKMKAACEAIRMDAPKTFHQACQWVAFFNCAARVFTRDGAGFQLDTLLRPYYEADVAAGILDDETTKFLIANLLLIDPHYYQISGVDENEKDLTCHLSYLILGGADMINISCNLTVRVHENCDKNFLRYAVECLFRHKNGWPRFCGDKTLCEGYMRNGVDKKTARERIAVGCNWMCVPGKEFPMNDTVKINVAKVMEVALEEMRSEASHSTARLYELFETHLKRAIEITAAGVNHHLDHIHDVTPELIMNLMFHGSLEKGLDASECAELYTVGVDGAGLAVVADSFGAMERRIEKEKVLSWDALYEALDNDFADERIHAMMQSAPKYCHGGTEADAWAKKMTESWARLVKA